MRLKDKDDCINCLTTLVTIRNCCIEQNMCNEFVDDLAGISNELADSLVDLAKDTTFIDFYNRTKKVAYENFKSDLQNEFGKFSTFRGIVRKTHPNKVFVPLKTVPINCNKTGQIFFFQNNVDQLLRVKSLSLFSNVEGLTINYGVSDVLQNKDIITGTYTVKLGLNTILIDEEFYFEFDNEIAVVWIENVQGLELREMNCGGSYMNRLNCFAGTVETSPNGIACFNDLTELQPYHARVFNYPVVCVNAEIICDIDQLICEYKEYFKTAFKYAWAVQILTEKLNSYRLNFFSQSNLAITEVLRTEMNNDKWKFLKRAVANVFEVAQQSICFDCLPEANGSVYLTSR